MIALEKVEAQTLLVWKTMKPSKIRVAEYGAGRSMNWIERIHTWFCWHNWCHVGTYDFQGEGAWRNADAGFNLFLCSKCKKDRLRFFVRKRNVAENQQT